MKDFQRVVDAAYAKYKDLKDGKNADYIAILTETPSDLFGVVIVPKDGKVYSAGDVDYVFSIQSVSKPFTATVPAYIITIPIWHISYIAVSL